MCLRLPSVVSALRGLDPCRVLYHVGDVVESCQRLVEHALYLGGTMMCPGCKQPTVKDDECMHMDRSALVLVPGHVGSRVVVVVVRWLVGFCVIWCVVIWCEVAGPD